MTKLTKAQVLEELWFQVLTEIRKSASDRASGKDKQAITGHQQMLDVCEAIEDIPAEVRKYALGKYLEQMQKLSWIHFYQTRKAERAEVCDADEIGLQIFKLVNWMKDDLSRSKRTNLLMQETLEKSAVPDATLREHGLQETVEVLHQNKAWNINSFHELGLLDPFPVDLPRAGKKAGKQKATNAKPNNTGGKAGEYKFIVSYLD